MHDVSSRIRSLERRVRVLSALSVVLILAFGVAVVSAFMATPARRFFAADSLVVKDLVLVDSSGTVRARLSSKMPDAIVRGRRMRRGEEASGLMLYDDAGQERGGYVTFAPSRNIALTLDTRNGQVASFAAESAGGAALGLFQGGDRLEIRADTATGTGLYVWQKRAMVGQLPPMTSTQEAKACTELRDEVSAAKARNVPVTDAQVRTACELHLSGAACDKCLGRRP